MAKKLNWSTVQRKVDDLNPLGINPRKISSEDKNKLKKSLEKFGLADIPVINLDGTIISGNQRCGVLQTLGKGQEVIDVRIPNRLLTEDELKEYNLTANTHAGEFDIDILLAEFSEFDFDELGIDIPEIEVLEVLEAEDDEFDESSVEVDKTDIVLGDLFEIGEHRLLCGDSTSIDDVNVLINNDTIDTIFTDPPYGISHSGKGIQGDTKGNDFGAILGDNDISVAVDSFNLCQSLFPDALSIFWGANYYASCLIDGFGWLIWDKEREGNTFSGAEIAFVNKSVKVDVFRHQWHGMIKASEMGSKRVHPTQKPIALAEWSFDNYKAGNNVLDLFLGSGTTMVAAHKTKRKCYGMELDPKYTEVIIKRMLKLDNNLTVKRNGKDETKKFLDKIT